MTLLREARTPPAMRIYAIGDVHGHLEKLRAVHDRIGEDLATRPVAEHMIVHVGDYVDRGPDSADVLDHLIRYVAADPERRVALLGNHDVGMLEFIRDAPVKTLYWQLSGGLHTCRSYGVAEADLFDEAQTRAELLRLVPPAHLAFLERDAFLMGLGDYLFAHAGVRPGVPPAEQTVHDLTWIREPFLDCPDDLGAVVVHGHTPTEHPDFQQNRIGIDTGAGFGGPITCLVLEEAAKGLLDESGYRPVLEP